MIFFATFLYQDKKVESIISKCVPAGFSQLLFPGGPPHSLAGGRTRRMSGKNIAP
jgi:hypothetical protein